MSKINIEPEWKEVLQDYFQSPEFANLTSFVKSEYNEKTIYPAPEEIFTAFWQTPFSRVRVVILGQDPYHGPNQAHGLSFSVKDGIELPPSLKNIYKEIEQEFGIQKDFKNGNLLNWASQGVFLLNSVLTVVAGLPASHRSIGWENFTDIVIQKLSDERENLVFILWGSFARSKKSLINSNKHLILEGVHPSPLSAHRGFFGCQHFLKCNDYLERHGQKPIVW